MVSLAAQVHVSRISFSTRFARIRKRPVRRPLACCAAPQPYAASRHASMNRIAAQVDVIIQLGTPDTMPGPPNEPALSEQI